MESQHHNKECRERFNAKYGRKEPEVAHPPEPELTLELATPSGQPEQSSSSFSSMSALLWATCRRRDNRKSKKSLGLIGQIVP